MDFRNEAAGFTGEYKSVSVTITWPSSAIIMNIYDTIKKLIDSL